MSEARSRHEARRPNLAPQAGRLLVLVMALGTVSSAVACANVARAADEAAPSEAPDVGFEPGDGDDDDAAEEPTIEILDSAEGAVSWSVREIADQVDSFFIDDRIDESLNRTRVRVRFGPRIATDGRTEMEVKVSLLLRLPKTEKRLSFFVAGGRDEGEDTDSLVNEDAGDGVATGFRLFLLDRAKLQVNLDAGLRFRPIPDPFTRLRFVRPFEFKRFILRPTQFLFWELHDGVGETTRLDLDRPITETLFGRLRGEAEWSETSNGIEWKALAFLFQRINEKSALRYRFRVKGETHPHGVVRNYLLSVRYRRRLYKKWLFGEVEPGAFFNRDDDWKISPEVTLRLEVVFGG